LDRSPGNPAPLLFWNAGLLDHLVPFTDIGFEPGGNLLRRARFRLDAKLDQAAFSRQHQIDKPHEITRS
jgi:hypothetical protein